MRVLQSSSGAPSPGRYGFRFFLGATGDEAVGFASARPVGLGAAVEGWAPPAFCFLSAKAPSFDQGRLSGVAGRGAARVSFLVAEDCSFWARR